jgi:putative tryptophan/tyrosine transport system substrate-binding protein
MIPRSRLPARLSLILGCALLVFAIAHSMPRVTTAQTAHKTYRVAYLSAAGRTPDGAPPRPLREALRRLGYLEGRNLAYEARFADGKFDRLPGFAAELVASKVDVIVAGGRAAVVAAKEATATIPIVIAPASGDAVATGLIASLARPGGNVTGLTDELEHLSAKRMELLKQTLPGSSRIAVLWNVDDPGMSLRYRAIERAAKVLGVEVEPHALRTVDDFEPVFAAMARRRPDALFLVTDALTNINHKQVVDFSTTHRVPAMYESVAVVRQGGLMSYGPTPEEMFGRAAAYVDRILKGAKPGDLPAEQPTKYHFTVNVKTARALGLTVPPAVLLRADEVLE